MQKTEETWVRSLGQEDSLEEEVATHFSILAWEIPWMEEPGELQSTGLQRAGHDLMTEQVHKRRLSLVYLDSLVATNLGPSCSPSGISL